MPKKNQWLILVLIGLLLAVIAMPTQKTVETTGIEEEYALDEELRLKAVLERIEGVGNVSVMITYKNSYEDSVEGVVIIADGGNDSVIKKSITEVVQALFDVDSHKIKVMKGNQAK